MDDSRILELFFSRSERAIDALAEKYGPICYKTAYNILQNREDAQECVNDSYLGFWNAVPPARPDPVLSFLLRIVRNLSCNRLDYNTRQKRGSPYYACIDELAECIPAPNRAEERLERAELTGYIEDFLMTQDQLGRMLFVRRYWYMDSFSDLARYAGLREGAVRTRLSRQRKALKEFLEKRGICV